MTVLIEEFKRERARADAMCFLGGVGGWEMLWGVIVLEGGWWRVAWRSPKSACLSAPLPDFKDYEIDTDVRVCKTRAGERMEMSVTILGVRSSRKTAWVTEG